MTLDRESIERRDFPLEERGYNPAAVDAHLSTLADEVDELRRGSAHSQGGTLAGAVSEQVRGILEAAQASAEEILRGAEIEAQEIRTQASHAAEQASGEVQRRREHAAAQARLYVERLSSSISALLARLETIDGELRTLTASLRGDTERLRGELAALEDELEGATAATQASEPTAQVSVLEAAGVPTDVSEPGPAPVAAPVPSARAETAAPVAAQPVEEVTEPVVETAPPSDAPASEDTEAARLIALNMALNGTPREETERYLAENYDLADRQRLLDEVYTSVEG